DYRTVDAVYGSGPKGRQRLAVAGVNTSTNRFTLRVFSVDVTDGDDPLTRAFSLSADNKSPTTTRDESFNPAVDIIAHDWNGDHVSDYASVFPRGTADGAYTYGLTVNDGQPGENPGPFSSTEVAGAPDSKRCGQLALVDLDQDGRKEVVVLAKEEDGTMRLHAYSVDRDLNITKYGSSYQVAAYSNANAVCALAAGNSEKGGSDKLYVIRHANPGHNSHLSLLSVTGQGGDLTWKEEATHTVKNGGIGGQSDADPWQFNPVASQLAVADINGDGRDECCVMGYATGSAPYLSVSVFNVEGGGFKGTAQIVGFGEIGIKNGEYVYAGLAAGAFGKEYSTWNDQGSAVRQLVTFYNYYDGPVEEDFLPTVRLYTPNLDDGDLQGFDKADEVDWLDPDDFDPHKEMPVLVPGDFGGDSITLGTPAKITIKQDIRPMVIVQNPPKHLDYIEDDDGDDKAWNLTRLESFYTQFEGTQSGSNIVKTSQRYASTFGKSTTLSEHMGVDLGFFKAEEKMSATFSHVKKHVDKMSDAQFKGRTQSYSTTTKKGDELNYRRQEVVLWRYPVLGETDDQGNPIYYQVAVPTPSTQHTNIGRTQRWYQPPHVCGNILTYPWNKELLKAGYFNVAASADLLADPGVSGISGGTTYDVKWTDTEKFKDGATTMVDNKTQTDMSASMSGMYDGIFGGVSAKAHYTHDECFQHSRSNQNTVTESTGFSINAKDADFDDSGLFGYNFHPQVYSTDVGALLTTYMAGLIEDNRDWWGERYGRHPNPALGLPHNWYEHKVEHPTGRTLWKWAAGQPNFNELQGMFFYDGGTKLDHILEQDIHKTVTAKCRVYNLAIDYDGNENGVQNLDVQFAHAKTKDPKQSELTTIGSDRISIGTWGEGDNPNWTFAEVTWDISNLDQGAYYLHVTVDPLDKVTEMAHHDNGDSYSDNRGWFGPVAVYDFGSHQSESGALKTAVTRDLRELDGQIEISPDTTLVGRAVTAEADIENSGSSLALDVYATYVDTAPDGSETEIADLHIPIIMPGESVRQQVRHFPETEGDHRISMVINDYGERSPDATGSYSVLPPLHPLESSDIAPGTGTASTDAAPLELEAQVAVEDNIHRLTRAGTILALDSLRAAAVTALLEEGSGTAVYTITGADTRAATVGKKGFLAYNSSEEQWDLITPGATGAALQVMEDGNNMIVAVDDGSAYDSDPTEGRVATEQAVLAYQGAAPTPAPTTAPTATPTPQPTTAPTPTAGPTAAPTPTPEPGPVPDPEPVDSNDVTPDEGTVSVDITPVSGDEQEAIQQGAQDLLDDGEASSVDDIRATRVKAAIGEPGGKAGFTIGNGNNMAAQADQQTALLVRDTSTGEWKRFAPGHSSDDLDVSESDSGLNVRVKDGGAYDRDGAADGSVETDLAIVTYTAAEPTPGGDGGGGCSLGGSALALLLLAIPAMAILRRR
ncbi:MAG: hypothetical protein K9L28_10370, partial [Synergistales bacterium]|nr:hypothetical protein [Synergistales bacterium]